MDFFGVGVKETKHGIEISPEFLVNSSKDILFKGKSFYAIWDEEEGLWSKNERKVVELVDRELFKVKEEFLITRGYGTSIQVKTLNNFNSGTWERYKKFAQNNFDTDIELDNSLTFLNTKVRKEDYVSRRLGYALEPGSIAAYDELIGTLYDPSERAKLEWAIGSIVSGDSRTIQKFIVINGATGTGKSTILEIVQKLFEGYYTAFQAKALASHSNEFAASSFKNNPLVALQHDGDLSRVDDNTILNSIVSHEMMEINEKHKPKYTMRIKSFLFMGTNSDVKITDSRSGLLRRLIDVQPSGRLVDTDRYFELIDQVNFELGAIAYHCLQVYKRMGRNYYSKYLPLTMMYRTDPFFNFVEANYYEFEREDLITLKRAWSMYKTYCDDSNIVKPLQLYKFREELKEYFVSFKEVDRIDGMQIRSTFSGFKKEKFRHHTPVEETESEYIPESSWIELKEHAPEDRIIDIAFEQFPAQYASSKGTPEKKWDDVTTVLKDIDPTKLHWVMLPEEHIVIDFDLKDENGEKNLALNLAAASKWPKTYVELSQSGKGVHLHYDYIGDTGDLARIYDKDIEIKVFSGRSALRRRLGLSNFLAVAALSSGLPMVRKGGKGVLNKQSIKSEKALRDMIIRNLRKEFHSGTKPSIDFIHKILEDAYNEGLGYDVTDLRPKILTFAMNSTNQSEYCVKLVSKMKFQSEAKSDSSEDAFDDDVLVFYDVEVFPNLFVVVWCEDGDDKQPVVMLNPGPTEIEPLLKRKLVGFYNKEYDDHILYARYIGYSLIELYKLSQRLINS